MSSLRPEDIYCDEKQTTSAKPVNKSFELASRPVKLRKKEHRRCVERKMKIRRNLFGPVDHENTENFLKKELDILSDLSNRKWNFDFSKETPLDGHWQWESVGQNDPTVPSAYRGTLHVEDHHVITKCEVQRSCSEAPGSFVLGVSPDHANLNAASRDRPALRKRPGSVLSPKSCHPKRKQTALQPSVKGFLTVKKKKQTHLSFSLDKTTFKGNKNQENPTFLQIIKSVSPTKPFSSNDQVAL